MNKYLKIWKELPTTEKFGNGLFFLCGLLSFNIFYQIKPRQINVGCSFNWSSLNSIFHYSV